MDFAVKAAISAVSSLHPALGVLQNAYDYYKDVKYSKEKCKSLLGRAERTLHTISQAIPENRCDSSAGNLERLQRNMEYVRDVMSTQCKTPFLKAILRQDDIENALDECNQSLDDCLSSFQISAHAIVIQHQDEYEEARRKDALEIKDICLRILEKQDDRAMLRALEVKDDHADEAMLAMQRELHQSSKEGPERRFIEQGLICLQRSTGRLAPTNSPRWTITAYDIDIDPEAELGGGGFGVVVRGEWRGLAVAVKRMKNNKKEDLMREVETWYTLHHDHIVPCYGASITADPPFIVLRYMQHGHLLQYLDSFSDGNRARLLYEVSLGIRYLHDEKIIHGDIKAVNVLVDDGGKACVTDFGLSIRYRKEQSAQTSGPTTGTLRFMAPEAIETGHLSYATDVYAFGMLIYESFTHRPPFLTESDDDVRAGCVTLERPTAQEIVDRGFTDAMWKLLTACISHDPGSRPTTKEISSKLIAMAKKWILPMLLSPSGSLSPSTPASLQISRSASYTDYVSSSVPGAEKPLPQPESPDTQQRDLPPCRMDCLIIRKRATIMFTDKGHPVVESHGMSVPCYPRHATFESDGATAFSAYVQYGPLVDEETWELIGPSITRTGANVDVLWRFSSDNLAQQWFNALRNYARPKGFRKSVAGMFRPRESKRVPKQTVEWRYRLVQWQKVVDGDMMYAYWNPWDKEHVVPPEPNWNYVEMSSDCREFDSDSDPQSFSYTQSYGNAPPVSWKVSLNGDAIRCEGTDSRSDHVSLVENRHFDTGENASGWFGAFRMAIQSQRADTPPPIIIVAQQPPPPIVSPTPYNSSPRVVWSSRSTPSPPTPMLQERPSPSPPYGPVIIPERPERSQSPPSSPIIPEIPSMSYIRKSSESS
ncbi:hypothetical protein CERSUDRAFT_118856 [Gelatoporia subvermispora B]|uniref:Protein kinase domain-containing protein n=1 Tax=Ceriporiopsis subvermispora (strain B) TaxID=914234 RepID=M2QJC7_CERS8|nr:hypothetical protein CERSUDRAFT_118856 [Gelatoporia subvermispora B]